MTGNNGALNSILKESQNKRIRVIHHPGEVNTAEIVYGKKRYKIERQTAVFVRDPDTGMGEMVTCAPYDNFFVFLLPTAVRGWFAMCACGGAAVIVGYNAYKNDASATDTGKMLVCYTHANTGRHADGST